MTGLKVAIAQVNVTVGDLDGNAEKIAQFIDQARSRKADLILFPELALTGYPPEDLLFKPSFIEENLTKLRSLAKLTHGTIALVGFVDRGTRGERYNGMAVLSQGKIVARYHKMELPNYGVFDEKRYFTPGNKPLVLDLVSSHPRQSVRVGVSICEDIWVNDGPCQQEARMGAQCLVNISASPYHAGKLRLREELLIRRARSHRLPIAYCNLLGGQDELVFDGGSLMVGPSGRFLTRAPQFEEGLFGVEVPIAPSRRKGKTSRAVQIPWEPSTQRWKPSPSARPRPMDEEIFQALILGTRDYFHKNGFSHAVLGLSGGIDSCLTAAVAVAALGKDRVTGVSMPSRYSSPQTQADAKRIARRLGIEFLEIPIEGIFKQFLEELRPLFKNRPIDATEENLQARIRGTLLMALSNKFGWLVLATGNKSEISTGYCTLYGDMVGGFAIIRDVPKTWVYRLSRVANRYFKTEVVPASVFRRLPTAELRANQKDQDTLPPYEVLDPIVRAYVEENQPARQIIRKLKVPALEVYQVLRMIDASEYKRRQAPPGIKITPRAFGRDRRMPITNRFREG